MSTNELIEESQAEPAEAAAPPVRITQGKLYLDKKMSQCFSFIVEVEPELLKKIEQAGKKNPNLFNKNTDQPKSKDNKGYQVSEGGAYQAVLEAIANTLDCKASSTSENGGKSLRLWASDAPSRRRPASRPGFCDQFASLLQPDVSAAENYSKSPSLLDLSKYPYMASLQVLETHLSNVVLERFKLEAASVSPLVDPYNDYNLTYVGPPTPSRGI